ncbi:acetyl-CoA carboxylase biotin carboxyl carrier protein [Krasilnikovia cinnamomea]|uniref:Biotin carboxyl carrier protein of acetyl-CoA carboxylase n=1 Tax=Krasilnikovia cinnamomea TaxID=349313 RepID=A0A4Q7ZL04_9ACTN|nr:biotin/lipoyl-containing protein [Krasilnikovia cinnamomea]RZU51632.1 acetyl-CoA carboxylase biotin carboxyl carrier protein [Krasilnikovia cinnamomea]
MTHSLTNNHRDQNATGADRTHRAPERERPHADLADLVERLRDSALRFLEEAPQPPRAMRLSADGVSFEIEWPEPGAGAPVDVPALELTPPERPAPPAAPPGRRFLAAPMVGVFYRASAPGAPPFVREGDVVAAGQQIGIIEAMKLMVPVEADQAGRVTAALKADGEPVEFGEHLFALADVDAG